MILLHLNLQHTTLEDFAEHVRNGLDYGGGLMSRLPGTVDGILGGDIPYAWYFERSYHEPVIVLQEAEISCVHRVFGIRYVHNCRIQETLSLHIMRCRTDLLRVILYLDLDQPDPDRDTAVFAKTALHNWLRPRWDDAMIVLSLADAPVEQALPVSERPTVYGETDVMTTVVHYLVTQKHLTGKTRTQQYACDRVGVAQRTYRNHRDGKKLLSDEEFQRRCGKSIERAAKECLGLG